MLRTDLETQHSEAIIPALQEYNVTIAILDHDWSGQCDVVCD